jgi:serine/threonine-protein kinase
MKANLARSYALAGKKADARRLLRELAELGRSAAVSPYRIATIWVALGDADATFDCLQQACRARDHWMVFLKVDPMLEAVRADRRFARLVAQVGFPADGRPPRRRAARPGRPVRRR